MPAGGGGAAVMIQIELGGWLTCRIWDGMRSLGTVWKIGRSPIKYSMEHSVSRTDVVSECSPPPMCGLGRSVGVEPALLLVEPSLQCRAHKQCGAGSDR